MTKNFKFFKLSFLFLLFVANNILAKRSPEFDFNSQNYGNKSANLIELIELKKHLENTKININIPAFLAISDRTIQDYLRQTNITLDKEKETSPALNQILEHWKLFQIKQQKEESLLPEAQKELEIIQKIIELSFLKPNDLNGYDSTKKEPNIKISEWLESQKNSRPELLLIVRSTGKEDSKEFANAGGNESIPAVTPKLYAINEAIGKVLMSYFGVRSIEQRLAAGDKSMLDDKNPLFMPVLIQVMIGEKIGGETDHRLVPSSGVMFTTEEKGFTKGVTQIDCAFGHNELVVLGLGATDSFYIYTTNIIHPIIRKKTDRMCSMIEQGKLSLKMVPNPEKIKKIPALKESEVLELTECGRKIQEYYDNEPTDVEFVIERVLNTIKDTKENPKIESKIWLVQARPLVQQNIKACYLNNNFLKNRETLKCRTIGIANGAAQLIESEQNIIMGKRGDEALRSFLDSKEKKNIRCIVSEEMVPATSHAATTIRGNQKAFIFAPPTVFSKIQEWVKSHKKFYVDVQRNLCVNISDLEEIKPIEILKDGWLKHPIPRLVSIMPQYFKYYLSKQDKEWLLKPVDNFPEKSINELLDYLKIYHSPAEISVYLQAIMHKLYKRVYLEINRQKKQKLIGHISNPLIKTQLIALLKQATISAKEIFEVCASAESELQILYAINFFEALIYQNPLPDEIVNGYSFGTILKTEKIEQKLLEEVSEKAIYPASYIAQIIKLKDFSFSPELSNLITEFAKKLSESKNSNLVKKFGNILHSVQELGIMPMWIHTSLAQELEKKQDPKYVIANLQKEFEQNKSFLNELLAKRTLIKNFNVSAFAESDEKIYNNIKKYFIENILSYFMSPEFINKVNSAFGSQSAKASTSSSSPENSFESELAKSATIGVMQNLIDCFDTSIKSLTSSLKYKNEESADITKKVTRFKEMVNLYFELMKKWLEFDVIKQAQDNLHSNIIVRVLTYLIESKRDKFDAKELEPASGINVGTFTLGTGSPGKATMFIQNISVENIFSAIHQSLLIEVCSLISKTKITQMQKPDLVAQITDGENSIFGKNTEWLKKNGNERSKIYFVGLSITNKSITYFYNLPISDHGITFSIEYFNDKKEIYYTVSCFGENASNRWPLTAAIVEMTTIISDFEKASETELIENGVTYHLKFDKKSKNLNDLALYFPFFYYATGNTDFMKKINIHIINLIRENRNPEQQKQIIKKLSNKIAYLNSDLSSFLHQHIIGYLSQFLIDLSGPEEINQTIEILRNTMNKLLLKQDSDICINTFNQIANSVIEIYPNLEILRTNIKDDSLVLDIINGSLKKDNPKAQNFLIEACNTEFPEIEGLALPYIIWSLTKTQNYSEYENIIKSYKPFLIKHKNHFLNLLQKRLTKLSKQNDISPKQFFYNLLNFINFIAEKQDLFTGFLEQKDIEPFFTEYIETLMSDLKEANKLKNYQNIIAYNIESFIPNIPTNLKKKYYNIFELLLPIIENDINQTLNYYEIQKYENFLIPLEQKNNSEHFLQPNFVTIIKKFNAIKNRSSLEYSIANKDQAFFDLIMKNETSLSNIFEPQSGKKESTPFKVAFEVQNIYALEKFFERIESEKPAVMDFQSQRFIRLIVKMLNQGDFNYLFNNNIFTQFGQLEEKRKNLIKIICDVLQTEHLDWYLPFSNPNLDIFLRFFENAKTENYISPEILDKINKNLEEIRQKS